MSRIQKSGPARGEAYAPSVDESIGTRLLPFVLSVIAGSVDIISFLGLNGLFTAHVTGNIVILAARFVAGGQAPVAHVLSVPVFMVALVPTRLLAAGLERLRFASLVPFLLLQFLLLSAFLLIGATAGPRDDPTAAMMVFAGMLGVSAMAVQNALVRISLTAAPSTAVMTTNITARRAWKRRSPPYGTTWPSSAARSTSTATCWPTRRRSSTTRSAPTTPT
jgi:uncharacterized membrane protein YoaK (UPF0700 family)